MEEFKKSIKKQRFNSTIILYARRNNRQHNKKM